MERQVNRPGQVGLPNMARAQEIEVLETAFYVGSRRPLSDLVWWKRWLVRAVYFIVGWCTGDGIEVQAICTTRERAIEMSNRPGWFFHELPINVPLPDETCQFREHAFPASDAAHKYPRLKLETVAVPRKQVEGVYALRDQIEELAARTRANGTA